MGLGLTARALFSTILCHLVTGNSVRLMIQNVDNTASRIGRLEVRMGTEWTAVCVANWDVNPYNAQVACRAAGYDGVGRTFINEALYGRSNATFSLRSVVCNGTEQTISDCSYIVCLALVCTCQHVGVDCNLGSGTTVIPSTPVTFPESVIITSLVSSSTTIAVYFQPPNNTHGVLLEYQIQYSHTPEFYNPECLTFNASTPGIPVIRRLTPDTDYYVRVRAVTNAGYGPFGNVMITRTLQALPFPPSRLLPTILNTSCIGVLWDPPDTSTVPVSAYALQGVVVKTGLVAWSVQLAYNVTQYTQCDLQPATTYNVTIWSINGSSQSTRTWTVFSTEQLDPPTPHPPVLVNVSTTTAAVQLFALTTGEGFTITAYQVKVELLGNHDQVPGATLGATVAQLTPSELGESYVLVIGDGNTYGGFSNHPLLPNQTYNVYFVVLSTLNNLTKFSYSRMAFTTLTPATTTTTTPSYSQTGGSVEGWVWGIIVALILIIILLMAISLLIWRQCPLSGCVADSVQKETEPKTSVHSQTEEIGHDQKKKDKDKKKKRRTERPKSKKHRKSSTVAPMPSYLNCASGNVKIACSATTKTGREISKGVLQSKPAHSTGSCVSDGSSTRVRPRPCDFMVVPSVFSVRSRCTRGEVVLAAADLCITLGPDCHSAVNVLKEELGLCDLKSVHR